MDSTTKISSSSVDIKSSFIKNNLQNVEIGNKGNLPIELVNGDATIALLNEDGNTVLNKLYLNDLGNVSVNDILKKYQELKVELTKVVFYFMSIRMEEYNGSCYSYEMKDDAEAFYTGKYELILFNSSKTEKIDVSFSKAGVWTLEPATETPITIELKKGDSLFFRIAKVPTNTVSHTTKAYKAYATLKFIG